MKLVFALLAFLALLNFVAAVRYDAVLGKNGKTHRVPVINEVLVNKINSDPKNTWQAGHNLGSAVDGLTLEEARVLCGFKKGGVQLPLKQIESFNVIASLPTAFSAITQWPQCPSISTIRDQSACGSCYAFAGAEAISDRSCIFLKKNISVSAGDIAFCCDSCGAGCDGGYPGSVWNWWQTNGVVEEPCYPYPLPSCDHHMPGSKNPCPTKEYNSPKCPSKCTNTSWNGPAWKLDRHHGRSAYSVSSSEDQIMAEIMKNGPVEAGFEVYEDFLTYKTGVYQHTTGELVGGHAVKILGWGVDGSTKYWIIANSWNPDWGNQGFFWMLRGVDECGIEDSIVAGIPKD